MWGALLGHRQEIAYYRRDFNTQEVILLRLKEHCELSGDEQNQAVCLHLLGMVAEERGQLEEAERWYRQSLAITERIGDESGQAQSLRQLGSVAERRGQLDEAERWYRQAEAILVRVNDPANL